MSLQPDAKASLQKAVRWWSFGHVWLVIAGPVLVIVAGLVTAWIAFRYPDPVVDVNYYQHGLKINATLQQKAQLPALQARNHAATIGASDESQQAR